MPQQFASNGRCDLPLRVQDTCQAAVWLHGQATQLLEHALHAESASQPPPASATDSDQQSSGQQRRLCAASLAEDGDVWVLPSQSTPDASKPTGVPELAWLGMDLQRLQGCQGSAAVPWVELAAELAAQARLRICPLPTQPSPDECMHPVLQMVVHGPAPRNAQHPAAAAVHMERQAIGPADSGGPLAAVPSPAASEAAATSGARGESATLDSCARGGSGGEAGTADVMSPAVLIKLEDASQVPGAKLNRVCSCILD